MTAKPLDKCCPCVDAEQVNEVILADHLEYDWEPGVRERKKWTRITLLGHLREHEPHTLYSLSDTKRGLVEYHKLLHEELGD